MSHEVVRKNKIRVYLCFQLVSAICLQKTGSETGFLAQNLDMLLTELFQGQILDKKVEQCFKTGDRT